MDVLVAVPTSLFLPDFVNRLTSPYMSSLDVPVPGRYFTPTEMSDFTPSDTFDFTPTLATLHQLQRLYTYTYLSLYTCLYQFTLICMTFHQHRSLDFTLNHFDFTLTSPDFTLTFSDFTLTLSEFTLTQACHFTLNNTFLLYTYPSLMLYTK